MTNSRNEAKKLLRHYVMLIAEKAGEPLTADCGGEIEDIVDLIIEAAVAETRKEESDD